MPAVDEDPALLAYDGWRAQREFLDAVESGDHDIVAFLTGCGSGKSVFGAVATLEGARIPRISVPGDGCRFPEDP